MCGSGGRAVSQRRRLRPSPRPHLRLRLCLRLCLRLRLVASRLVSFLPVSSRLRMCLHLRFCLVWSGQSVSVYLSNRSVRPSARPSVCLFVCPFV